MSRARSALHGAHMRDLTITHKRVILDIKNCFLKAATLQNGMMICNSIASRNHVGKRIVSSFRQFPPHFLISLLQVIFFLLKISPTTLNGVGMWFILEYMMPKHVSNESTSFRFNNFIQ